MLLTCYRPCPESTDYFFFQLLLTIGLQINHSPFKIIHHMSRVTSVKIIGINNPITFRYRSYIQIYKRTVKDNRATTLSARHSYKYFLKN